MLNFAMPPEVKDKSYYKNEYDKYWNECLEQAEAHFKSADRPLDDGFDNSEVRAFASKIFEQYSNTEQAVGYYLKFFPQDPHRAWREDPILKDETRDELVGDILAEMHPLNKKFYY